MILEKYVGAFQLVTASLPHLLQKAVRSSLRCLKIDILSKNLKTFQRNENLLVRYKTLFRVVKTNKAVRKSHLNLHELKH